MCVFLCAEIIYCIPSRCPLTFLVVGMKKPYHMTIFENHDVLAGRVLYTKTIYRTIIGTPVHYFASGVVVFDLGVHRFSLCYQ